MGYMASIEYTFEQDDFPPQVVVNLKVVLNSFLGLDTIDSRLIFSIFSILFIFVILY